MNDRPPKDKSSTNSPLCAFATLRLCVTLLAWIILSPLLPTITTSQTIYTVVLGNQSYVVGSSTLRSGLFVSYDSARSWKHIGPENVKGYAMDAVDTSNGRILYLAAGNGIHRSTDYGQSWKIVTDWRMTEVLDVKVDQRNPNYIYAATAFGFWRSTDRGETWENPDGELKEKYCYRMPHNDNAEMLLMSTCSSTDSSNYYSKDLGLTWREIDRWWNDRGEQYYDMVKVTESPVMITTRYDSSSKQISIPIYPVLIARYLSGLSYLDFKLDDSITIYPPNLELAATHNFVPPVHALGAMGSNQARFILAGTFGDGLYKWDGTTWEPAGLPGSQVWRIVVKDYSVPVEVGHEH